MEPQEQAQQMLVNTISAYEQGLLDLSDDQLRELVGLAQQAGLSIDVRTDLGRMAKAVVNEGLLGLPGLVAGAFGSEMFDPISEGERSAANIAGLASMFAGGAGLARTLGRKALKSATGTGVRQSLGQMRAGLRGASQARKASQTAVSEAKKELALAEEVLETLKSAGADKGPIKAATRIVKQKQKALADAPGVGGTASSMIRAAQRATPTRRELAEIASIQKAIANSPMLSRAFQGAVGFGAAGGLRGLSEGDPIGGAISSGAMGALGGAAYGSGLGQSAYGYLKGNPKLSAGAGTLLALSMMND
jgi:hypothetical protein